MVLLAIYAVIVLLIVVVGAGLIVTVRAVSEAQAERRREEGGETRPISWREREREEVGPVKPGRAVLSRRGCLAVEFVSALCGFPGLGWLMSGRVRAGVLLIAVVPGIVWAAWPAYVCVSGALRGGAHILFAYLPALAAGSTIALGACEFSSRRAARSPDQTLD